MIDILNEIEKGEGGYYKGMANVFERLNEHLYGTQRGMYYLIGGKSGSGKSTFVDANFLLAPYLAGENFDCFYFSLEMSELAKVARWMPAFLWHKKKYLTSHSEILGLGGKKISLETKKNIKEILKEFEDFMNWLKFIPSKTNPTGVRNELLAHAKKNGKIITQPFIDSQGKAGEKLSGYEPKDPNKYTIVIGDHLKLFSKERGFDVKSNIDKLSEYSVEFRNIFGYTFVYLQQFNRSLGAVDRRKYEGDDLRPTSEDFKDTGDTFQDANVVMTLFNPKEYGITEYKGYDIAEIYKRGYFFRMVDVLKNREGETDLSIGMYGRFECNVWKELPRLKDNKGNKIVLDYAALKI